MRAALVFGLVLLSCRREPTPEVRKDPIAVPDAHGPLELEAALLFGGKVIDLDRLTVAHTLSPTPPLDAVATRSLAWLAARGQTVRAFDLVTGKLTLTTAAGCGNLRVMGERVLCRSNDKVFILDPSGTATELVVGNEPFAFVPLATRILVQRVKGAIEIYDDKGALVSRNPSIDTFAGLLRDEDNDRYCVAQDQNLECFNADGTRRYRAAVPFSKGSGSLFSFNSGSNGSYYWSQRDDAKGPEFVLMRLADGGLVTKLRTAIDRVVLRDGGSLAGLLRVDGELRWLAPDGKILWATPLAPTLGTHPRPLIAGDLLIVSYTHSAKRSFAVVAYRLQTGDVVWSRSFEEPEPDGGAYRFDVSLGVKRGRLVVRNGLDGAAGSLHLLDPATGASRLDL